MSVFPSPNDNYRVDDNTRAVLEHHIYAAGLDATGESLRCKGYVIIPHIKLCLVEVFSKCRSTDSFFEVCTVKLASIVETCYLSVTYGYISII